MAQSATAPVPVLLLIPYIPSLPQFQSYWYSTVYYCHSTNPSDTLQSTVAPVTSCWFNTVHYCPSTSPTDPVPVLQIPLSTTAPVPLLLIWHSPLLPQYQSYCWYPTFHLCPSASPIDTLQSTTATVPILLIPYNPLLPQWQVLFLTQSTTAPVRALLIPNSQLLPNPTVNYCPSIRDDKVNYYQYQSSWYDAHYCSSTSPSDTLKSSLVPLPVLLLSYSPLLSQYQFYWYSAVHLCPGTCRIDTSSSEIAPIPVLLIPCS